MGALMLLALLAFAGGGGDDDSKRATPTPGRAPRGPRTEDGPEQEAEPDVDDYGLPDWIPEGATLSRSPPPAAVAPEHEIVRTGAWFWDDQRTFTGQKLGSSFYNDNWNPFAPPEWKTLTRIAAPPAEARLLILRIWIRGVRDNPPNTYGGQWDITGSLEVPLVVSKVEIVPHKLSPEMQLPPFTFRLTRNADGSITVDAAVLGRFALNNAAMVLEFAFRD